MTAGDLLVAYYAFFGLSAVASGVVIVGKVQLLVAKLRKRKLQRYWAKTGNTEAQRAAMLEEQRDQHKLRMREALSYIVVAVCEDLPMSALTMVNQIV